MKKLLLSVVTIVTISLSSLGQAPEAFKYQAVVRDVGGFILNNQAVGYRLAILQGSPSGGAVYTETFSPTTNDFGLVNLEIGTGITTDDFTLIDWSNGPYFMETAADVTGGTNYIIMGTSQLMSVPYALYAKTSGNGEGPQGPQGIQGPAGNDGTNGTNGNDGAVGATGPQGPAGADGTNGTDGVDGNGIVSTTDNGDGTFTFTYDDGTTFTTSDLTGPQGPIGLTGPAGATGPQGAIGLTGPAGATGAQGPIGLTGAAGAAGATGAQGPIGLTGPAGAAGATGPQGTIGLTGPAGATGATGPQGTIGLTGPAGATGPQGPAGLLTNGTTAGNTPYWNGTQWVVNNSNIHNNGAGVGIGTATPNASAKVEIASTTQGFLPPRMTTVQRDAIATPAAGLVIYNTTTNCLNFFVGSGWNETCGTAVVIVGTITTINCGTSTVTGSLTAGTAASSVGVSVPYTGGNAGSYNAQSVSSTGVTGLTANLTAGSLANGSGSVTYTITGTPSAAGTATFAITFGGQSCNLTISVAAAAPIYPVGSVFCAGATTVVDVTNPSTGKIWMDRNLGATQAATSSTDAASYGDLYQWGRRSDGHQCRTSPTTTALSSVDQPANGNFIKAPSAPYDWRSPQNVNLWQGVNGVNNPCPSGYRLPTETEINAERLSWSTNTKAGAFASPLKLPVAGYRANVLSGCSVCAAGSYGLYWSSTVSGTNSRYLFYDSGAALMTDQFRASGCSVRCIKD